MRDPGGTSASTAVIGPSLSSRLVHSLSVDVGIDVPMSDGTGLATDVIRPAGGGPVPAVVVRTPYNRRTPASRGLQVDALGLAEAGYAVVIQDVRGRFGSGGDFEPFVDEQADGIDTIEWAASQPWCNGRVGMAGISYLGYCQLAAAVRRPEPLQAIIPGLTPCDVRDGWIREGEEPNHGFNLAWLLGALLPADPRTADPAGPLDAWSRPGATAAAGSPIDQLIAGSPLAGAWLEWNRPAPYAGNPSIPTRDAIAGVPIPALVVAGWFDVFQPSTFELHDTLIESVLVAGPWGHRGLPLARDAGARDHGAAAAFDLAGAQRMFLDQHLRDADTAPVGARVFVTGANRWESHAAWPPPTSGLTLFPAAGGQLSDTAEDVMVDVGLDAEDPTPSVGGRVFPWAPDLVPGPFDQTARDARRDVVTFTSEPLSNAVTVAGGVTLTVVDADQPEGMVFATLSDMGPDTSVWNVADGGAAVTGPSTRVELGHAAHQFGAGHRVRLTLSFGAFPRYRWRPGRGRRRIALGPGTRLEMGIL